MPVHACYCCCSGGTPVAVGEEQFGTMEELEPGDMILAASVDPATKNLVWKTSSIEFSQGTGGEQVPALMIGFSRNGEDEQSLVVTGKQLFYMPNGALRRAETLVSGLDVLLMSDGTQAAVTAVSTAVVRNIHHIATSREPAMSIDNHLISIKGVVCGDYALQISGFGRDVDAENKRPVFGTGEYVERYKHQIVIGSMGVRAVNPSALRLPTAESLPGFIPEKRDEDSILPFAIRSFFTLQQSVDIFNTAVVSGVWQYPPPSVNVKMADNLLDTCKEAYPDINFSTYLSGDGNIGVNAYALLLSGQKYVIIYAGLLSLTTLQPGALALIIAQAIAWFDSSTGFKCIGQADYDSIDIVTTVWNTFNYDGFVPAAIAEVASLFQMISSANDGSAVPDDTCTTISTDCRLEAMNAAFNSLPLPACASGAIEQQ
jgi:hypothetical protein